MDHDGLQRVKHRKLKADCRQRIAKSRGQRAEKKTTDGSSILSTAHARTHVCCLNARLFDAHYLRCFVSRPFPPPTQASSRRSASGETFNVCDKQLTEGLKGVSAEMMKDIVIAYEPVWAIGTGLTATPEVAQETHAYIRSWFVDNYSQEVADNVIIQYGGSVNDANVDSLMACPDIDGALVGGASLKADAFSAIINFKPL